MKRYKKESLHFDDDEELDNFLISLKDNQTVPDGIDRDRFGYDLEVLTEYDDEPWL